jgi:hypothetical protein
MGVVENRIAGCFAGCTYFSGGVAHTLKRQMPLC